MYRQEVEHEGVTAYVSPQIESISGYAAEEYLAVPGFWLEKMHPDDKERVMEEDERTDLTGEPFEIEYRVIHRHGHTVWVRNEAVLIRGEEG